MIYSLNKNIQHVLSRFWGHHIAHMEIVYVVTVLYVLLITGLVLGGTYFSVEDFLGENATSTLMCYLNNKRLG